MQTKVIPLSSVSVNPNNPRTISEDKFSKLINSILVFPKMLAIRPIAVDKTNVILGGNMRYRALAEIAGMSDNDLCERLAKDRKYNKMTKQEQNNLLANWQRFRNKPEIEVISAKDLTESEFNEFIVKDNVSFGAWSYEMLANNFDELDLIDWGVDVWEMKDELNVGGNEAKEDDYDIPEEVRTDIVPGDLFEIGEHKLLCGDSTQTDEWAKIMTGEMADLVITDPPYNVGIQGGNHGDPGRKNGLKIKNDSMKDDAFYQFLYDFYTALSTYTKSGGVWYVWHADREVANFRKAMTEAGIPVRQCLIWVKNSMILGRQDYQWQHEPCLYGWKEGGAHGWYSDRKQTTLLHFDRPTRNAEHPTMKPVPLISYQINNSSKRGDIVADGFGGSGTTMVAAHQIGRKCRMIELDPKYCWVILERMKKLDESLEIKRNGKNYEIKIS